jgi:hypothetical protein
MKEFSSLLKKLYSALNKETVERENVLFVLKNNAGITLKSGDIFIKDGVLEICASPTVKNEIKLKEEAVLSSLKTAFNLSYSRVLYK